ncbi:MAG: DNA methyltransferase, partial [Burkholderiales bacterium]
PAFELNERQGAQPHFIDLCQLLGVPTPGSAGDYIFEQDTLVLGEARGYADVFYRDRFAWENKAPGRNLDAALKQLLTYSLALSNPPLLVVCDRLTTRIHTQFNGHPSEMHTVLLAELDQPEKQALLRRLWLEPESFRPKKTSRDITEAAAKSFATLAEGLRKRKKLGSDHDFAQQNSGSDPNLVYADKVAHFLTQCLFCFFAEDVGLLPGRMFEGLVNNKHLTADKLTRGLTNLFTVMREGGLYGNDDIPWFNGGLFKKVNVPELSIMEVTELRNAAALNWSAIDVSIFGTLFERGLDPSKRSQLGAHYTDPATILRIVEPVLTRPLLQKWELLAQEIRGLQAKSTKKGDKHYKAAQAKFVLWLEHLKDYRVLDPACGSGNFLFLGLKALKDIEHKSHLDAAAMGLDRQADLVTGPHNVLGIELNEYAAELARVTVWIGELQWRIEHGYDFKTNPVLEPLDHIECRDALLSFIAGGTGSGARAGQMPGPHASKGAAKSAPASAPPTHQNLMEGGDNAYAAPAISVRAALEQEMGSDHDFAQQNSGSDPISCGAIARRSATEAPWPKASVVIGNPPFLGDKRMRTELGDDYTNALRSVFIGRVPGGADLVTYWFEKARAHLASGELCIAGLVATNSIRQSLNRTVLDRICQTTKIFEAWSDEPWVNAGAAVHVSLVCIGAIDICHLNGHLVERINSDLTDGTRGLNLTLARPLRENENASFFGLCLAGPFTISGQRARDWLKLPNPNGRSNAEVLTPIWNGKDVTEREADRWAVDFGGDMDESQASLFEEPFEHVRLEVLPARKENNRSSRVRWWFRHGETRPGLRRASASLDRVVGTVERSKHRYFVWIPAGVAAEHRLIVIPRGDDATFGVLSSRIHITWAISCGSTLEDRPGYNTKVCFLPFPFPAGLTPADTAHQRTETVDGGAIIPGNWGQSPNSPGTMPASGQAKLESDPNSPLAPVQYAQAATKNVATNGVDLEGGWAAGGSAQVKKEPAQRAGDTEQNPLPPSHPAHAANVKANATAIATAAKRLNDLRENWLNPKEWTDRVSEVIPLGMDKSPYPDRILPKLGHEKDLAERTLTKLYNQRPAWLDAAHKALDMAVAQAYGWSDYNAAVPDEEILKRLLALNLERSAG